MPPTELLVNGERRRVDVDPKRTLLSVLREELDLTGAKYGCGEGQCGACTVLVDDVAARSCLLNLGAVAGKSVTTIEGLATGDRLHPLQQAFLDAGAMQCGYCTAGMIMSSAFLLKKSPGADEAEIRHALEGNVCRCGTYARIVAAVRAAAPATGTTRG